jgi:hypothetical protein
MSSRGWMAMIGTVALIIALGGCSVTSEPPGTINGVVYLTDDAGNQKPGAPALTRVSLFEAGSGNMIQAITSGADGTFHFSVPPGNYSVSAGGRAEPVRVDSGRPSDVRVALPPELKNDAQGARGVELETYDPAN